MGSMLLILLVIQGNWVWIPTVDFEDKYACEEVRAHIQAEWPGLDAQCIEYRDV